MRARWICLGLSLPLLLTLAPGCGSDPDDVGDRLVVVSASPTTGDGFVFNAVEVVTSDVGCPEGDEATANNGFWDGCTDETYEPKTVDYADIVLRNEVRPGVEEGRPLEVYRVRVTFYDAAGDTPAYAPPIVADTALVVDPGSEATLTVPVSSLLMKNGFDDVTGLRDLFFRGDVTSQVGLTAVVDIYAIDVLNDEEVHAQARLGIVFVNPNI